jgi:hypothetical protein
VRLPWSKREEGWELTPEELEERARELKRFAQTVRGRVRVRVTKHKEAPPLTCWASEGDNPRRVKQVHVGAASSAADVKARIVLTVREQRSHFVAIGRLLHFVDPESEDLASSSVFGIAIITAEDVSMIEADAVAGRLGPWRESVFSNDRDAEAVEGQWLFIMQVIRTNVREARDA